MDGYPKLAHKHHVSLQENAHLAQENLRLQKEVEEPRPQLALSKQRWFSHQGWSSVHSMKIGVDIPIINAIWYTHYIAIIYI